MKTIQYKTLLNTLTIASVITALVSTVGLLMHFPMMASFGCILHIALLGTWSISLILGLITKKVQLSDWKSCILTGGCQTIALAAIFMAFLYAFADLLSNF
ncbi:MAG: hypothetical protein E7594_03865 [Ruminococcaceae bacterium]|nr:hypothetical protein [Oscillospiraceae bacterium]